jgi:60 kDa SS-A/Ro ribonucleoprotein
MANKALFGKTPRGPKVRETDTKNRAGGIAYKFGAEHALAQLACTGTFNDTFYGKAVDQLEGIRKAADQCSPEYLAKCAVYARQKGYMKDMPAALAVMLSKSDPALLDKVFDRVIDNGKQLRNFVQFIRSGAFGRKSLGSGPKRLIQRWFAKRSDWSVFRASVGNDPSLADIIKLARPRPGDVLRFPNEKDQRDASEREFARRALYAYLIGRDFEPAALPKIVQEFEAWKRGERTESGVPNVDFRMLTSLPLTKEDWAEIAKRGGWHQTRMNLNTYTRQGVFEITGMESVIAGKLKDAEAIAKAKVFPYQLLAAYLNTGPQPQGYGFHRYGRQPAKPQVAVPQRVRLALQDALEIAVENVPVYDGRVAVVVDTSGSMHSPVTGHRQGATTKVSCVDVAALVGATVMRKNPLAVVIPVDTRVHNTDMLNARDSIMTNAERLRKLGGGGTDLGAAMRFIETAKAAPDLVIMVSDNESWFNPNGPRRSWQGTSVQESWQRIRQRNPEAKMVCIDIQTSLSTQAHDGHGVMNIGGFSDTIWETISRFVSGDGPQTWVEEIKRVNLNEEPAGRPATS